MLTDNELSILCEEAEKVMIDSDYKSPELYEVLHSLIYHIYNLRHYRNYPSEVLETAELKAIEKCYKAIPKYDMVKAEKARLNRGLHTNNQRGIYRFLEIVITRALLSAFTAINAKQHNEIILLSLDEYNSEGDLVLELADIKNIDVELMIDLKTIEDRKMAFERRLDIIEKGNK